MFDTPLAHIISGSEQIRHEVLRALSQTWPQLNRNTRIYYVQYTTVLINRFDRKRDEPYDELYLERFGWRLSKWSGTEEGSIKCAYDVPTDTLFVYK